MPLSHKQKIFSNFLLQFLNLDSTLNSFKKKMALLPVAF